MPYGEEDGTNVALSVTLLEGELGGGSLMGVARCRVGRITPVRALSASAERRCVKMDPHAR